MGINLSTGSYAFEVQLGQRLLSEAEKRGRSAISIFLATYVPEWLR